MGERLIFLVPQATMIVLVTRVLGNAFFGKYALVLTWIAVFQLVANFGISECLAREIGRDPELGPRYLSRGLVLGSIFSVIAMGVMGAAAWVAHYPSDVTRAILLATGTLLPANIVATCRGALLANRKVEYMMWVGLAESLVLLPLNIYWILSGAGLLPIVGTIVLAKFVTGLLALWLVHDFVTSVVGPMKGAVFGQLWKTILPFGVGSLIVFPSVRFDIFLLSKMATFETLGLYSAATKLMELLFVVPMAFFMVMLPRTARDLSGLPARRTDRLERSLRWYFTIVIPVGIGVIGFAEPIILLVYGKAFGGAAPLLQIQMSTFLLLTMDVILAMICKGAGFQRVDLAFVITSTVVNLTLNILLIPSMMAVGAAVAVSLSILVGVVLRWRFVSRSIVQVKWLVLLRDPVVTALLLIGISLLLERWISWRVLALWYVVGYSTAMLMRVRFAGDPIKAALRPGRMEGE